MKNHLLKVLLISIFLVLSLVACQSAEPEEGPAESYWSYYEYCENKQFETAERYLDEEARAQKAAIGVCGFTHDAINRYEAERGGTERTFSEEPVTEISENSAVMSWVDEQGYLAIVHLIKTEDGWKVANTVWSD